MKRKALFLVTAYLTATMCLSLAGCGGQGIFNPEKNITVITREDGSGSKAAFMELIGLKGKSDVSGVIIATGTDAVLAEVKNNKYAIAFESLGFVSEEVKKMKLNGIEATVENIKNGTYPLSRPLNVVFKSSTIDEDVNKAYYEFLQSKGAQKIISEEGYVSTKENTVDYVIKSGLSGKVDISGSTSLRPLMIKLAKEFENLQNGVTVTVAGGGSGTGYANGENGTSDFGMISEEFNSEKAPNCTYYEVAKDGLAVIINKENTFDNITTQQIKNIYNSEEPVETKIKKWAQIV